MDWDEIKEALCILFWAIIAVIVIVFVIAGVFYSIDNVPVVVKKGNVVLYEGRSACVSVKSSGDTTRVDISGGLFCLFPKAYYSGRDITTEGTK